MFHLSYSSAIALTEEVKLFSPLVRTQRIPISMQACAVIAGIRYMSNIAVIPLVRYSKTASFTR